MSTDPGGSSTPARPVRADARRNRARILTAAQAVFSREGAAGSTEQVAAEAGVAIGTVFRHFPTKRDLLQAIMKDLAQRLQSEAAELAAHGDPDTALFEFFSSLVAEAAGKLSVVGLLADAGVGLSMGDSVSGLAPQISLLLVRAQESGSVRRDVQPEAVTALIAATCQGALHGAWDANLQRSALSVIFDGLRTPAASPQTPIRFPPRH